MATLTGKKIKNSYKDLLQVSNSNSGIDSTLRTISDGEATDSVLQLSSSAVNISSAGALQYAGTAITATAAELNALDGITATVSELNILDGVTSTASELNILDGVTSTAAELNVLDGYTGSVTELNYLDGTTLGTVVASKAVAVDSNKDITGFRNVTLTGELDAATLALSGNADIDGTLEADAITVNGTALDEVIADTIGAMVTGNTESGISVTYDDSDNTLDFNVADPTITLSGDVTGSATMTNLGNVTISTTIANNSLALGTDTTGDYVATVAAGEGIDLSGSGTEGRAVTISAEIADSSNKGVASFDSTDFTVSSGAVTVNAERVQDIAGAMFSSNTESGITVTYQDADNTIDLTVGTVALGSGTSGNYVDNVTGGTGVTVSGSAGEGWEPAISIGQAVSTTSDVTFADIAATDITAGGNVVITGNLTVNGSSVTNSSTNTTIEDALIELGSGNTGSNSNDLGLILERGSTGNNAFMGWDESADKFVMGTTTATGSSTGSLTISTGTLVANLEGNVTGNASGTAATVTGAAQTAITSVGTLSGLAVSGNQTVGGTLGVTGAATTSYTTIGSSAKAFRNTFIHSSAPQNTDGAVGDIWITYS